jgi:ribosomal RNA-processing protein 9
MGYVETLFGHQDIIVGIDALRSENAVTAGSRDKTLRFWKIVEESQLVFRGGGKSAFRELLEGGMVDVEDTEQQDEQGVTIIENQAIQGAQAKAKRKNAKSLKFIEGSIECVAMIDETTFLSGGDSG